MNPNNLLLTSDDPIDKVGYRNSGSIVVPQATNQGGAILVTIPHNLPYAPLCIGSFSEVADFSEYYEVGSPPKFFFPLFNSWGERINVVYESDTTNIYVYLINFDTTRTLYYRITGLIPTNATLVERLSPSEMKSFTLNTDNNYLKIFDSNRSPYTVPGSGFLTASIPHGLGYRPTAFVFTEDEDGRIRASGSENSIGINGIASTSYVTDSNLVVDIDTVFSNIALHYRIYYDD